MYALLLLAVVILSILMIPFGMPGTWIIASAAAVYRITLPDGGVSYFTVGVLFAMAIVSAVIEMSLSARYAKKYGGSRRAGWGAIIGGFVGAIFGLPIPIVGSVIGAFFGAFVGAFVFEMTAGTAVAGSTKVATGAMIGRVVGAAMNVAIGVVMGVWVMFAALTP
jgi:uncharacterized protein YqgC (DUF456 family)